MTRLVVLQLIGDVLTAIDIARANLLPDNPSRHQLDDLRVLLDSRQRKLSQGTFDDRALDFQVVAKDLIEVDNQIQGSLQEVGNVDEILTNVQRYIDVVTKMIATTGPFV